MRAAGHKQLRRLGSRTELVIVVSTAKHASSPRWKWEFESPRSHHPRHRGTRHFGAQPCAGGETRYTHWSQKPAPNGTWVRIPPGVLLRIGAICRRCRCEGSGYFSGEGPSWPGVRIPNAWSNLVPGNDLLKGTGLTGAQPRPLREGPTSERKRLHDNQKEVTSW